MSYIEESIAYMNGLSTGYSSGYASALTWFKAQIGTECAIHVPTFVPKPQDVQADIYALDYWMYQHIHESGAHANLTTASHVFLPSSIKKKSLFIRMYKDKTFIVNDFGPFCRFQHLGHFRNTRFLLMSPGDGGCRKNDKDIIAPHTVVANDPISEVKRRYNIFFYGHLPKPYINPPISELRYRIFEALYGASNSIIQAYNVEENVNSLTTNRTDDLCRRCSYQCKTCYFANTLPQYKNAPKISAFRFRELMMSSTFCIVARGDNPGCPKLAESIASGCIPVIIMDQKLPFEQDLNYSLFSVRFDSMAVLQNPGIIKDVLSHMTHDTTLNMRKNLHLVSDMFSVRTGGTAFNMQTKLMQQMCSR